MESRARFVLLFFLMAAPSFPLLGQAQNYKDEAKTATTAVNITGTVAIANGGTGAITPAAARSNLGLGSLATRSPLGAPDGTKFLRDDGTWAPVVGGVSSVAELFLTHVEVKYGDSAIYARAVHSKGLK